MSTAATPRIIRESRPVQPTAATKTIYSIRRRHILREIGFWRDRSHGPESLHQLRMELAALRACRALVS